MPLYKVRNLFQAGRVKAFWKIEAGITRGLVPEEEQNQVASQERIKRLQQDLQAARQKVAVKDRQLSRLQKQKDTVQPPEDEIDENVKSPEELSGIGGGGRGYEAVGRRWLSMLTIPPEGLKPDERVLDAGCGIGRIALPLTEYMSREGSYEGFDIEPRAITWCQYNITPNYPNFQFQVADIYNKMYNQRGTQQPHEYSFPYPDDSFDFAFLASVFTHLLPEAVENYIAELSRVLRSGGRCVISYFLLNDRSIESIEAGNISRQTFSYKYDTYRLQNDKVPEHAIAHDEDSIRGMYEKHGLRMMEPIQYGRWAGGKGPGRQDVIWAIKK